MKPTLTYPLTKQQAFDYVWHHFIVEKNPLAIRGTACVYNTPEGGCAVGCVLPPDLRRRIGLSSFGMQRVIDALAGVESNQPPAQLAAVFAEEIAAALGLENLEFFRELQAAHDNSAIEEDGEIERRFRDAAARYGLVVSK